MTVLTLRKKEKGKKKNPLSPDVIFTSALIYCMINIIIVYIVCI